MCQNGTKFNSNWDHQHVYISIKHLHEQQTMAKNVLEIVWALQKERKNWLRRVQRVFHEIFMNHDLIPLSVHLMCLFMISTKVEESTSTSNPTRTLSVTYLLADHSKIKQNFKVGVHWNVTRRLNKRLFKNLYKNIVNKPSDPSSENCWKRK